MASIVCVFLLSSLKIILAREESALYRNPKGDLSAGNFKLNPFHYLWVEKLESSMVADQLDCPFLCVGAPKCYSLNMAAYPDSKGLYLCELLATDKYRATEKFHANATFHHYSPSVRFIDLFGLLFIFTIQVTTADDFKLLYFHV